MATSSDDAGFCPVTNNTVWLATGKASRHPRVSLAIELLLQAAAGWTDP